MEVNKMKERIYVGVLTDWSEAWVGENGSFYCGTTDKQKQVTKNAINYMDLIIYTTDFHSIKSDHFSINGGQWQLHNVAEYKTENPENYGLNKTASMSPQLINTLDEAVNKSVSGIIVPKHVYFQDGNIESFSPELVEDAFGEKIITAEEFLEKNFTYIISPKQFWDGTRIKGDYGLPKITNSKIPSVDYTVFDLLAKKYPSEKYELIFVNTGVVENICRHYTSVGQKEKYPTSRVINLEDATTELSGIGFSTNQHVKESMKSMSTDLGIEYVKTQTLIDEIKQYQGGKNE